jgi:hypothetical protein
MSDPINNPNLAFTSITNQIRLQPSLLSVNPGIADLEDTSRLIQSLRHSAAAEMTERGYDPQVFGNPIDRLFPPNRLVTPLGAKLVHAIQAASTGAAFTPTDSIMPGDHVMLTQPPPAGHGVPNYIRVGDQGTVTELSDDQARVDWTDHDETWWLPLNCLELI